MIDTDLFMWNILLFKDEKLFLCVIFFVKRDSMDIFNSNFLCVLCIFRE